MKNENKNEKEKVIVFGYSDNPERYAFKAAQMLKDYGHEVVTFNSREQNPLELPPSCDTVTLYMGEAISDKFSDTLKGLKFKRIIFNPGTENVKLEKALADIGVEVVHGCTLVMLRTDQF